MTGTPRGAARSVRDSSALDRLRAHLGAVAAAGRAAFQAQSMDELFQVLYRDLRAVMDATIFVLGAYHEASETVDIVGQVDAGVMLAGGSFPLGSGFTSEVIRTRRPRLIRRWSTEGPRIQVMYANQQQGALPLPESGISVPLLVRDRVVGVLSVQSYQPAAYDDDDVLLLQAVASHAAAAMENLGRTRRRDAQLQRRISELEAILAGVMDALVIVDGSGAVVRLNQAARALLRVDDGLNSIVLGQPLDQARWERWPAGPRAVAEALAPMIAAVRAGEAARDVEVEMHEEGRRVLSFSGSPLRDGDGPAGGVIVFRDVTGRKEVERLKDEMLSIASHDLKTPTTVIKMQAQLSLRGIRTGKATPESLARSLETVEHQADRLVRLLDLLLDLSRIESGRLELSLGECDLGSMVREMAGSVQALTERHRITVDGPAELFGTWDEQRVEQVLQNLLTNAVKYSPQGGSVRVRIEVREDEHAVWVSVRDEGIGLPVDELPHVFEQFYRAQGGRKLEGNGLGLYICQGIIAAHGGRIWAESDGPGTGSAFHFSLPWQRPRTEPTDRESERP